MRPESVKDLVDIIADAAASGRKLEVVGGGTRAEIGAPRDVERLDMTGFAGVIEYDPAELVLTAGAGTPLAEIEALVASNNQMLAFEPHGAPGSTLGGIVAAGVSGSRRVSRGAVRDHLLGFKAVSGRGEAFVGGAKVVKNVTGYDLPKLACNSWGRLFAMTEVTLKVLPAPETTLTLAADGLDPAAAVTLMSKALGSQADVAAAACANGVTALRLEGFGPSVEARRVLLEAMTPLRALSNDEAGTFWSSLMNPLPDAERLLKVHVPPSKAAELIDFADATERGALAAWAIDWAGALIWLSYRGFPDPIRAVAEGWSGGYATMWRADAELRAASPTFNELPRPVRDLEVRIRRAFDPMGVFETGRFLDGYDAD